MRENCREEPDEIKGIAEKSQVNHMKLKILNLLHSRRL
jgi:N6-adenosine-specific RNA methylase IME4